MNDEKMIAILVVDDEQSMRETLAEVLELNDYKVSTADSGLAALEMLSRDYYDILITDLVMGGVDGITLIKMVRDRGYVLPIIVMTGFGTIERAVESMKAGAWEFITKPFHNEQIVMAVEKALETKKLQERAGERDFFENLSRIDAMTGIPNYRSIMDTLASELHRCERYGHPLSVLMIDVDLFKDCNDAYGHLTGDQVLKNMGALIMETIRGSDVAARYGGEEFLVVLPETTVDEALLVAERVRSVIHAHSFKQENGEPIAEPMSVTIGIASYPEDGTSSNELIEVADKSLYRGKKTGRNRVVAYSREA